MSAHLDPSRLLRLALAADAAASGASGLLLALAARPLGEWLGLSPDLLRAAGLAFLPWAALVGWLATRRTIARSVGWTVVALNGVFVVASAAAPWLGWISPNGLGTAFVLAQAGAVLILTEAQAIGLRRSTESQALALA